MTDFALLRSSYDRLRTGTLWSSTGRCKGYAVANPGEAARIDAWVTALVAGDRPEPPTLATATGQGIVGLISAGLEPISAPPPPPPPSASGGLLSIFPLPAPTGGTLGARGKITYLDKADELIENMTILGQLVVRAPGVRLRGCALVGPTGNVGNTQERSNGEDVQLYAKATAGTLTLERCEIRDNDWRAGVFSSTPNLILRECHIHHNGGDQVGEENLQHGVYWASGSGLIERCLIEDNRVMGVQFYSSPKGAVMRHSLLRRNGKDGVIFGGTAEGCLLEDCALTENARYGISTQASSLGPGNVARNNYVWGNKVGGVSGAGISVSGTLGSPPPEGW